MGSSPLEGSITLVVGSGTNTDALPICIDWRMQLDKFLHDRLPPEDILFARDTKTVETNPLSCGNAPEYLHPPYAPLPPISIGELQWPTGASRYARALYAVDWSTMLAVAQACWGYDGSESPSDVPSNWNPSYPTEATAKSLELNINGGAEGLFRAPMFPLAPYRVPGNGVALWLLPLVDARYAAIHAARESTETAPEDWQAFFDDLYGGSLPADAVESEYGDVDPRLFRTVQPQPKGNLLDVAAITVGMRVVVDPSTGAYRIINQQSSANRRNLTLGFSVDPTTGLTSGTTSPKLISGGKRGIAMVPTEIDVYCQRDGKAIKFSHTLDDGIVFRRLPIWTSYEASTGSDTTTNAFVARLAISLADWADSGGQYCFAGPIAYQPSGYDDYLSISLFETQEDCDLIEVAAKQDGSKYILRSRIYELPSMFLPAVVLCNGVESDCSNQMFKFTLTADLSGTSAAANIYHMDGADEKLAADGGTVQNTLSDFSHLVTGDDGLCMKVADKYWAIHPESASSITNRRPSFYEVAFTCDSHGWTSDPARGFSADRTSSITYTITTTIGDFPLSLTHTSLPTVDNPFDMDWKSGDSGLIARVDDTHYRVVKVMRQTCLRFRFIITSDVGTGLTPNVTATAICPSNTESGPPPSGSLTLKDIYGKAYNAKADHKGVAEYDWNNDWYYITECQHLSLHFRGKLYSTLSGGASTMQVTPEYGLGPGALPGNPTTVYNVHGWQDGATNAKVRVEWNPELNHYEAYQMDCSA